MGKLGEAICVNNISRYFTASVFLKTYRPFFYAEHIFVNIFFTFFSILTPHQRNIAVYIVKKCSNSVKKYMYFLNSSQSDLTALIVVLPTNKNKWKKNSCSLRNEKLLSLKGHF